jgi:putative glutamine amidotransferase
MKYVLLWGGVDINPAIYGQKPHPKTQPFSDRRDQEELRQLRQAIENDIPVIGVCRGAQLICAFNGGTLYQHTNDHNVSHDIHTKDGIFKEVEAGHHQMMNPKGNFVVYGYDGRVSVAEDAEGRSHTIVDAPEIIWYPDTKCLAIQPHPEWMPSDYPFNVWLNNLIFKLIGAQNVF